MDIAVRRREWRSRGLDGRQHPAAPHGETSIRCRLTPALRPIGALSPVFLVAVSLCCLAFPQIYLALALPTQTANTRALLLAGGAQYAAAFHRSCPQKTEPPREDES